MEEYLKQEEEDRRKYQEYIARRRREVESQQKDVVDKLRQNLAEKYTIKKRLEDFDSEGKKYPKNFLNDIISRLPPEKPPQEFKDIGEILNHLSQKRNQLVTK